MSHAHPLPIPAIDFQHFVIRPLTADDTEAYRALRRRILEVGDGRYHSASYRRDKTFETEEKMRAWCTETHEHCVMGTFYDGELVGIMTAVAEGPKENLLASWDSVWLDARFRKLGIAKHAYQKLEEWTKKNGYRYVETFVRADNHRVLGIRKKRGSLHIYTKRKEVWADGSVEDAHFFITHLFPATREEKDGYSRAIIHLKTILSSLEGESAAEDPLQQKTT